MAYLKKCRFIAPVLMCELLWSTVHPTLLHAAEAASAMVPAPVKTSGASEQVNGSKTLSLEESLTGVAKQHFRDAWRLNEIQDYAGASLKFRLAYDESKDARLLWNIAACEKGLRHYAKMTLLIEQYLREGSPLIGEKDLSDAQTVLDEIRTLVAQLELTINEPAATVFVDDEKVDATPGSKLRVDMGPRKIRVSKVGFEDWSTVQNVLGGTTVPVTVELKKVRHVGTLRIQADGAYDVLVDGTRVGIGNWTGELPSGAHTLDVRGKGMLPYQSDVVVTDEQMNLVRVSLRPETAANAQNSNTWLWVTGGTLLAAGLVTGGYFLLRPGETVHATMIAGTMQPGTINLP